MSVVVRRPHIRGIFWFENIGVRIFNGVVAVYSIGCDGCDC